MDQPRDIPNLSSLRGTLGQKLSRIDHYIQARVRNRFGPTVRFLSRFIPAGGVIADIGANHGKMTKNFARLHGGSCTVLAFEPLEYNYTMLERIVGKRPNVRIYRLALSDRSGQGDLFVPVKPSLHLLPGSAHLGVESARDRFGTRSARDVYRQVIALDRLDAVVQRDGISRLDFMKIDVQGAETLVLRGGLTSIRRFRPAIYCELQQVCAGYFGLSVDDTVNLLHDLGYDMFAPDERRGTLTPCPRHRPDVRDYLFLHPRGGGSQAVEICPG